MKVYAIFVIYITTKIQEQLAINTLNSFKTKFNMRYVAVVNRYYSNDKSFGKSDMGEFFDHIIYNDRNCLARAWNKGFSYAHSKGADFVIFSNLGLIIIDDGLDRLIEQARDHKNKKVLVFSGNRIMGGVIRRYEEGLAKVIVSTMWDNFTLFLVRRNFQRAIGRFDENFSPAYYEDIDIQRRLELSGNEHIAVEACKYKHEQSSSIRFHEDVEWAHKHLSSINTAQYMVDKWGGFRSDIKFIHPYDDKTKGLKYWRKTAS